MATDPDVVDTDSAAGATTDDTSADDEGEAARAAADGHRPAVSVDGLSGVTTATDDEAAAIAAAIAAHLQDRRAAAAAAAADADDEEDDPHRTWAFAGRLEAIGEAADRPPAGTPDSAWGAAGRADRF